MSETKKEELQFTCCYRTFVETFLLFLTIMAGAFLDLFLYDYLSRHFGDSDIMEDIITFGFTILMLAIPIVILILFDMKSKTQGTVQLYDDHAIVIFKNKKLILKKETFYMEYRKVGRFRRAWFIRIGNHSTRLNVPYNLNGKLYDDSLERAMMSIIDAGLSKYYSRGM